MQVFIFLIKKLFENIKDEKFSIEHEIIPNLLKSKQLKVR